MKAMIFYDRSGVIQSVVQVSAQAATRPSSVHFAVLEVDLKGAKSLHDIHRNYRVDVATCRLIQQAETSAYPCKE